MAASPATTGTSATAGGSITTGSRADHTQPGASRFVTIVRDIARGGIAGIIVGIVVAGLGGRVVMRLATILHEDAVGRLTENGELIGRISLNGTLALITFGGLGMGLLAGTIWVIVSPWIPGGGLRRAGLTALLAIALGTPSLVQEFNPDFTILQHDPVVVALLVALVGLAGLSMALVDGVLDRRLPHAARLRAVSSVAYVAVSAMGLLVLVPVVSILKDQPDYAAPVRLFWAIAATGACTLAWWVLRARGSVTPPRRLRLAASASLLVAAALGVLTSLPDILGAAGVSL